MRADSSDTINIASLLLKKFLNRTYSQNLNKFGRARKFIEMGILVLRRTAFLVLVIKVKWYLYSLGKKRMVWHQSGVHPSNSMSFCINFPYSRFVDYSPNRFRRISFVASHNTFVSIITVSVYMSKHIGRFDSTSKHIVLQMDVT
jgi:hypothetical protein